MQQSDYDRQEKYLLECFVQSNYEFYHIKWGGNSPTKSFSSWNWAAFFFGSEWMLYRKMYGEAVALVILRMMLSFFSPGLYWLSSLIIGLCVAIYGNYWYYRKASSAVHKARNDEPANAEQLLRKSGGTNISIVIIIELTSLIFQLV